MKTLLQTLVLLLFFQTAKAGNPEWLLKLTIEQKDGSKTVGYISAEGGISKGSVKSTCYLIKVPDRLDIPCQDNAISLFTNILEQLKAQSEKAEEAGNDIKMEAILKKIMHF